MQTLLATLEKHEPKKTRVARYDKHDLWNFQTYFSFNIDFY